ncbi:MAG: GIY-YIG nuclease family protein [Bacteroidia bacterium]
MEYKVYIIYSSHLDKYYVGHTDNIDRRLKEHNTGQTRYTSTGDAWILKHTEPFATRADAMKREREIKARKSRKYIESLFKVG